MIGSGSTLFAPLLPHETYERIYRNGPDVIVAGSTAPLGKAEKVPGGWKVNGRWPFASACQHADWLAGFCVMSEGGKPIRASTEARWSRRLVPAAEWRIEDTWGRGRAERHREPRYPARRQNRHRSRSFFVRVAALSAGTPRPHGAACPAAFPGRRSGRDRRRRARRARRIRRDRPPADARFRSVPIRSRAHRRGSGRRRAASSKSRPRATGATRRPERCGVRRCSTRASRPAFGSWRPAAVSPMPALRSVAQPRSTRTHRCNGACATCTPPPSTRGYTSANMSPEARPSLAVMDGMSSAIRSIRHRHVMNLQAREFTPSRQRWNENDRRGGTARRGGLSRQPLAVAPFHVRSRGISPVGACSAKVGSPPDHCGRSRIGRRNRRLSPTPGIVSGGLAGLCCERPSQFQRDRGNQRLHKDRFAGTIVGLTQWRASSEATTGRPRLLRFAAARLSADPFRRVPGRDQTGVWPARRW